MSLTKSYEEFVQFEIGNIIWDDDFTGLADAEDAAEERLASQQSAFADRNTTITFEYSNPSVGIDSGGNFVKHDIIGGPTVRQKVGIQPMEISVNGVAKQATAQSLELLRYAKEATLLSDRFAQDSVTVHVVSVTTDPLSDGGAADLTDGDFLYSFSLECVELHESGA